MGLSTAAINIMLDALGATAAYASVHTGSPGLTGAYEITGGAPAYARQSITWNTAADKNLDSSNQPVFNIPSGTTASHFGIWATVTGGTFFGGTGLASTEYFGSQGTFTLTDADVNLT